MTIVLGFDYLTGNDLIIGMRAGSNNLELHRDEVNALNVFPVPDGDTGTNMSMTLRSAVLEGEKESESGIGKVAKAAGRGALMGARGNSGVILSQVFRGIYKELDNHQQVDAMIWAQALQSGADTAYKAVMKPVEGTILTVVRECAHGALAAARQGADVAATTRAALQAGRIALARTPQQLPILKEAGVVDSGGQGWVYFIEGMLSAWSGEEIDYSATPVVQREYIVPTAEEEVDLNHPYCTEVLVKGSANFDRDRVTRKLEAIGNCVLVITDFDMMKIHVHTAHPGKVIELLLEMGTLHDLKINNMMDEINERNETLIANGERETQAVPALGVVAVATGDGLKEVLASLGVGALVEGGQTMNPSTEDLLNAVENLSAKEVIILPNNKNIIMAAQQVKELTTKKVYVIPTISVVQGISAMVSFNSEGETEDVVASMQEAASRVLSGEVTQAVRDAQVNGHTIKEGDFLGLVDEHIKVVKDNVTDTVKAIIELMVDDGKELITVFYGMEVNETEAEQVRELIENLSPDQDVEMHNGGQPHYYYFIGVE
ncbi:MAG: DAK2 domain-containing protein [Methylocystaceae bacterium]